MANFLVSRSDSSDRRILTDFQHWDMPVPQLHCTLHGTPLEIDTCAFRGIGRIVRYQYGPETSHVFWTVDRATRLPKPDGAPPEHGGKINAMNNLHMLTEGMAHKR